MNVRCRYCGKESEDNSGVCKSCERRYEAPRHRRRCALAARVHSVIFDKHERPVHAVVLTACSIVEVVWGDAGGDWCWFSSGTGDAKRAAVPAIMRLHRLCEGLER